MTARFQWRVFRKIFSVEKALAEIATGVAMTVELALYAVQEKLRPSCSRVVHRHCLGKKGLMLSRCGDPAYIDCSQGYCLEHCAAICAGLCDGGPEGDEDEAEVIYPVSTRKKDDGRVQS